MSAVTKMPSLMMASLDEMRQDLGDGKYLRLTSELAAIRNSRTDYCEVTYRHTHTVLIPNFSADDELVSKHRTVCTNHKQRCELIAGGASDFYTVYSTIHCESNIHQHAVKQIRKATTSGQGFKVYSRPGCKTVTSWSSSASVCEAPLRDDNCTYTDGDRAGTSVRGGA